MRVAVNSLSLIARLFALKPGRGHLSHIHTYSSQYITAFTYSRTFHRSAVNMLNNNNGEPDNEVTPKDDGVSPKTSAKSLVGNSVRSFSKDIEDLHNTACAQGETTYIDPATGYTVLTGFAHLKRGKCCGNACRHCPFDHVNVKKKTTSRNNR